MKNRWTEEGGYKQLLAVAVPLILSTAAWSVQHFVDRMFLSWYSSEAIAAATPAGVLNFSIMNLFIGTASYVGTFVAQYYGAKRFHRIGPILWQGVYISILGEFFLISIIPLAAPLFDLIGHDQVVRSNEVIYFQILCLGGGPMIASSAMAGFFAGRGNTWPVMWVNLTATLVNIVMDYVLIFGNWGSSEMGIKGAGIATALSEVFAFLAYSVLILYISRGKNYHILKGWKPEKRLFLRLIRFGFPSGVHFFLDMTGFAIFILLVGRLGTINLAATNIAFNISTLAFMPMIGCGMGVTVLVGQYLGKNEPELAQKSAYSGFHLTFLYMIIVAALYILAPDIFVAPFAARADQENFGEIYELTVILLRFVAVYSLFDTMSIIFASAIRGAGDTRYVMFMIVIISALVLVIPTYIAIVIMRKGLMIAWVIISIYAISLGLAFYFRFLGGKWKSMRVIERAPMPLPPEFTGRAEGLLSEEISDTEDESL